MERIRDCENALDLILAPSNIVELGHRDLDLEAGTFTPAVRRLIRVITRLRQHPNYQKKIRWILEAEFPAMSKDPSGFSYQLQEHAGLTAVLLDSAFQDHLGEKRANMHGMVSRNDSSNELNRNIVFVNAVSPRKGEIIRHEAMHLLYRETFGEYVSIGRDDEAYLWSAVRDEMLAYLMGGDRIELNISRLLPVGVTIDNVLDAWSSSRGQAWAKSWNLFVRTYKGIRSSPEAILRLKSALFDSESFEAFFKKTMNGTGQVR